MSKISMSELQELIAEQVESLMYKDIDLGIDDLRYKEVERMKKIIENQERIIDNLMSQLE